MFCFVESGFVALAGLELGMQLRMVLKSKY